MKTDTIRISEHAQLKTYIPDPEIGYKLYKKRPGIILAPGGAYLIHATREKEGVALEFLAKGYNVFLLEYSLGFSSREAKEQTSGKLDTGLMSRKTEFSVNIIYMSTADMVSVWQIKYIHIIKKKFSRILPSGLLLQINGWNEDKK